MKKCSVVVQHCVNFISWVGVAGAITAVLPDSTVAQLVPDASLGAERSVVTPNTVIRGLPSDRIDGGAIRGSNLFHSFQQFNIGEVRGAYFVNPVGIENILSRVTGGSRSEILGRLGVLGNANLFLLNPNGIVFGPNASLDITGSFTATTANAITLGDQGFFSATQPENSSLLAIAPGALFFDQQTRPVGNIQNAGSLVVGSGSSLTLLGNQVTNTGSLIAPKGTVKILGDRIGLLENAYIDVSSTTGGGNVFIGGSYQGKGELPNANQTFIGSKVAINANALTNGNGGKVIIWADKDTRVSGKINARGGSVSGNGGFVEISGKQSLDYNGQVDARAPHGVIGALLLDPTNIDIVAMNADTTNLSDVDQFSDPNLGLNGTSISVASINGATSNVVLQATNDITVNTNVFMITPGVGFIAQAGRNIISNGFISTLSGDVQLIAGNNITLVNIFSSIFTDGANTLLNAGNNILVADGAVVDTSASIFGNNSGNIQVKTGSLSIRNGGQLIANNSSGIGEPGNITVQASGAVTISGESSGFLSSVVGGAAGRGGNINVEAKSLSLSGGAQLQAILLQGAPGGQGQAGTIQVHTSDFVDISGVSPGGFSSGLLTSSERGASGSAGDIQVSTSAFRVADGAIVNAQTFNSGNAGNVTINARSFEAVGGGQVLTLTRAEGNGGNITINANESIRLSGRDNGYASRLTSFGRDIVNNEGSASALIPSAVVGSMGNGGSVSLNTNKVILTDGAGISSSTFGSGKAGDLSIRATDSVELSHNSGLFAQVNEGATGDGGSLIVQTGSLHVRDGSVISTVSLGQGRAGTIGITALNSIEVSGGDSGITADTLSLQPAGNIAISTQKLTVQDNAAISTSTSGAGAAGDLFIQASDSVTVKGPGVLLTRVNEGATGKGGNLTILTGRLVVQNGAQVGTGSFSQGQSGKLNIITSESVELSGSGSGLFTQAQSSGNANDLRIETKRLFINAGAQISSGTFSTGQGGLLNVTASDSVNLSGAGSAIISQTDSGGNAGDLHISTANLNILDFATISARSRGTGRASNIAISIDNLLNADDGKISTSAAQSSGGTIDITARNIRLRGDSDITTFVNSGTGGGGNITLVAQSILAFNDSDILSFARDGQGGNITLNTRAFFGQNYRPAPPSNDPRTLDGNNRVDVNASGTVSGIITIPDTTFIQNSLTQLAQNLIDPNTLLANSCIVRSRERGQNSNFLITGSGGLPVRPGDPTPASFPTGEVRSLPQPPTDQAWKPGDSIAEPQGIYRLANGKLVMSRECEP